MRNFQVYRPNQPEDREEKGLGNAPDEVAFEGTIFSDGTVAVRWLTAYGSTASFSSLEDLLAVHGHDDYDSIINYSPEWSSEPPQLPEDDEE